MSIGFNVSEITAFTFNNCQLPNIPFSVLLHRTKSTQLGQSSVLSNEPHSPEAGSNQPTSGAAAERTRVQSLRPNRVRQQQNALLRSKRRAHLNEPEANSMEAGSGGEPNLAEDAIEARSLDTEDLEALRPQDAASGGNLKPLAPESLDAAEGQPAKRTQQAAPNGRTTIEPKVKSLTVNLNTVVDQRTLISLLTGLDLLEDLQLNYMQLNLTNFEPDLEADPTNSATTASDEQFNHQAIAQADAPVTHTTRVSQSSSIAPTTNGNDRVQQSPPSFSQVSAASSQTSATAASSTTPETTPSTATTTTPAPQTTQILTNQMPSSSIPMTSAVQNTHLRTQQPTTVTSPPTTTTTTATTTTNANRARQKPQLKPINWTTTTTSSQTGGSKPLISMGAPRGLMHAQATGIPTTVTSATPAPPPTTASMLSSTSTTTTTTTTTTTPPPTTMVPSVSLSTAAASVRLISTGTGSQQPTTTTSSSTATNTHHSKPIHMTTNSNIVAISPNQMIQYAPTTNNPTSNRSSSGMFHLTSASNNPIVSTSVSSSVSSSSHNSQPLTSTTNGAGTQTNNVLPNRLHQAPSNWQSQPITTTATATTHSQGNSQSSQAMNPPAGTRLSLNGHQLDGFTNTNNLQTSNSYWLSSSSSSAPNAATVTATNPTTSADPTISAPINTPAFTNSMHSNGFGIRTGGSPVPLAFSPNIISNSNSNQANGFRQTTPTSSSVGFRTFAGTMSGNRRLQSGQSATTSSSNNVDETSNPFVAAGGRLYSANNNNKPTIQSGRRQTIGSHSFAPTSTGDQVFRNQQVTPPIGAFVDGDLARTSMNLIRRKRFIAGASNEFELSFGELLPNLRSLKLESFIDLSAHVNGKDSSSGGKPQGAHRRIKRQFDQADMPEKDESHLTRSESDGLNGDSDTLLAEESSVHHNSVMASNRGDSPIHMIHNKRSQSGQHQIISPISSQSNKPSSAAAVDPLWQSASDTNSAPVVVVAGERDSQPNGDWSTSDDQDSAAANQKNTQPEQPQIDSATEARLKHLSLLLVKMFSKLSKLKVLQLSSNDIPYWPDNVLFDSRNSLSRLYLISNNIRQLGKNSLANLTELHTLDVSSNQLRQLSADMFRDLIRLRNIRACRNLFRKLPSKLFAKIHQSSHNHHHNNKTNQLSMGKSFMLANRLENVDFSKNRYLTQLSADMFALATGNSQSAPSLVDASHSPIVSLNLSDCSFNDQLIGRSPEVLFATLPELTSVSLNGNKLREILMTNALFGKNNRLQRLDLSHNQLSIMSANLFNANASQIIELQLHHNQLSQIPEQFLFNLKKLRKLSLAYNRLSSLNARMFFTNQFVEFIDLSHNQLLTLNTQQSGMIPFGNGANLKYLNLAHNNLTHFESDLFDIAWSFYTNLNLLDLSHNQFSGQISMPIFYTIADEMLLNLASNSIQSVGVEALMQHEQILDRYSAFEGENPANGNNLASSDHESNGQHNRQQSKVPTVSIKLTGNPISCDCMLEPLVSYTRRVAAATNPSLVASIFSNNQASSSSSSSSHSLLHSPPSIGTDDSLTASSRYSFMDGANNRHDDSATNYNHAMGNSNGEAAKHQPQVFYQFKFNDLYCAQPINLQRRLLSHISIGDLLCPIRDERLCPSQCECHYQSSFKTVIVDCNNRKLSRVPHQLTDAANFLHFDIESSIRSVANRSIASVDKVIIRLDNNELKSMDQLVKLFTISNNSSMLQSSELRNRFARAPLRGRANSEPSSVESHSAGQPLSSSSAQPLSSEPASASAANSQPTSSGKKVISPVIIARNMNGVGSGAGRQRSRRQAADVNEFGATTPATASILGAELGTEAGFDSVVANHHLTSADQITDAPANPLIAATPTPANSNQDTPFISTAVLESAEEFRNKRYPLTCELYLDHNLIDTIPASFLEILDQVKSSSMLSTLHPPQAALPTLMLEPPHHTKLNNIANSPDPDPMRASGTLLNSAISERDPMGVNSDGSERLFGRQPLAQEKKAALMETINQNVRLNQLQNQRQNLNQNQETGAKFSVSPSLVVLSLRYNNLATIEAKILQRLSKLIKSSNTKLYLGHNPFNCSDNFAQPINSTNSANDPQFNGSENRLTLGGSEMLPASPMGDHLMAASDATSGAYLENADDLSQSASSDDPTFSGSQGGVHSNQLMPVDCPVGQLKTWLTRHHANIGDLDELYCVRMSAELAEKLRLAANSTTGSTSERLRLNSVGTINKWDHDHPWASSVPTSTLGRSGNLVSSINGSLVHKNGLTWDSELLSSTAKLIDVDLYDLCPYSGNQLNASASGLLSASHQQILISVAVVFIIISLCLLLMLVYFGDTQTILAFIYIHMNPIYSCLRLNESHLDGDKLYDAFVSYSSADRDIVMELIEKLELQQDANGIHASRLHKLSPGKSLDKSHDTLVTEADLVSTRPDMNESCGNIQQSNTLNRRTNSFQDLSTMSRSTSRIMMGEDVGGSALDINTYNGGDTSGRMSPSSNSSEARVPYRLCIHERDWLPGHLISWNIVNSVQNSRRTILILSKEFIKSVWFQVEFHTAYYQMLEDKIDRLIVIVRGELPPKHELDKNLAFLLTTKTYLTWGEKWFWERLHYALPHRSIPPAMASNKKFKIQKQIKQQHHHHHIPKKNNGHSANQLQTQKTDLAASLSARQKPLIMSNIGKDCSNLLIPSGHNNQSGQTAVGSASSSGSTASNARSSASSFLSGGSSTGNLFNPTATTNNDLLSRTNTTTTTKLTIGPNESAFNLNSSSQLGVDSGRATAASGTSIGQTSSKQHRPTHTGVTSIMLDGNSSESIHPINSRIKARKQEKLQNFVDKTISDHFNLSEL